MIFIGLIRLLSPFIAGASNMPARRFITYITVGAGIWVATFSVLGYLFWQSLDQLIAITKQGSLALAALIVLVAGGIALYRYLRARSPRRSSEGPDPGPPSDSGCWNERLGAVATLAMCGNRRCGSGTLRAGMRVTDTSFSLGPSSLERPGE